MSSVPADENMFLTAPIGRLFLANALPMAFVMAMSGLLNLVDAVFLGHFVGPVALAAVSFSFPAVMLLIAIASLAGGGMSSLFARHLGAGDRTSAAAIFASGHGLCLSLGAGIIAVYFATTPHLLPWLAKGSGEVAKYVGDYLFILICGAPVQFLMSLHADAARNEGRAGFMALLSVAVTLANIVLNYILIVSLNMGVAGSAWGTVAAQLIGLLLLLELRRRDSRMLPLSVLKAHDWRGNWRAILGLGLPLSLSFAGMALVSGAVIAALNWNDAPDYADTVAAYGIVTRIFGFAFMPLMALALATQTIVGINSGAGLIRRSNATLFGAIGLAFGYCGLLELILFAASARIGGTFVGDGDVVMRVHLILRPMLIFYLTSGPVLILAIYYQAIGTPGRTAVLMLLKPFFLAPVLIFAFSALLRPDFLWFAFPAADLVILTFAGSMLVRHIRAPGATRTSAEKMETAS